MGFHMNKMTTISAGLLRSQAFVGGKWRDAASGATFEVTNPATGDVITAVADLSADETRAAIEAAKEAQKGWAAMTAKARAAICANGTISFWQIRKNWQNSSFSNRASPWPRP